MALWSSPDLQKLAPGVKLHAESDFDTPRPSNHQKRARKHDFRIYFRRNLDISKNHVFGIVVDDLRVWEYQNRIQHVILPQGQFFEGPGNSGEQF